MAKGSAKNSDLIYLSKSDLEVEYRLHI
jgi:hypothetical protein